jgi:hypothetical protein
MPSELLVIGVACYGLAVMLDHSLDYGQVFGMLRRHIFWSVAGFRERRYIVTALKQEGFGERLAAMDAAYWLIAARRQDLVILLCRKCMLLWIAVAVCLFLNVPLTGYVVVLGSGYLASIFDK